MLRFFRQIRQSLITDNKVSKYLLYGIGEILLVVIGILIALQVNNWNEERQLRSEEIEVLKNIKKDMGNTIEEFEYLNGIRDKVLYGTKGIFELAATKQIKEEALDSLIGLTFYRPTFNNKQGAIDLLFSSGKINLIRNDSIRELLLAWPGMIDDMVEEEEYATELFLDLYYPTVAKYVVLDNIVALVYSTSFFGTKTTEVSYTPLPIDHDYDGLLENREFLNHLRMRATHMRINNEEVNDLIRYAQKLISLINAEINS